MKKYLELLQKCPLFTGVEPEELLRLLDCLGSQLRPFEKKEVLLAEGDPAAYIGIVLAGTLHIEQTDYYGSRSIVGQAGPGELFGESFACAGAAAMPLDVIAATDGTALLIDCNRILSPCCNVCGFHQQLIRNLVRVMAQKNLAFHQKLTLVARRTTREKLLAYLLAQAKRAGSRSFSIPFDRQQLADYLLVDRSGLSAEIGKLRAEGILECHREHFTLQESPFADSLI